jgi:glycine oxidase
VPHPDVIIAGAGIIGVSLALELRERGATVLVLDRAQPGAEASSAAAGMLAAADPETPAELRDFAQQSASLYPEFVNKIEEASGLKADFRRNGTLDLRAEAINLDRFCPLLQDEIKRLEPSLNVESFKPYFIIEDSVDPVLLMQAALEAARNRGVEIRSGNVQEIRSAAGRVEVITDISTLPAGKAVNCCGAWAGAPVRPRKGQMMYLQPSRSGLLEHVVRAPGAYIVPRSSGKILVGATVEDVGFDKTVDPATIRQLHNAAARYVPELASANVISSWAGLRPGTPDDLPIMGEPSPRVFIAGGHYRNGILLAPATARFMADLITGKPLAADLSSFSPARFAQAPA